MNRTALLQVSQRRSSGSAAPPVPPVCGLQGSLQPALLSHVLRSLSAGVCEAFPAIKLREVTGSWKGSPAATGAGGGGRGGGWRWSWSCVSVRSQLISVQSVWAERKLWMLFSLWSFFFFFFFFMNIWAGKNSESFVFHSLYSSFLYCLCLHSDFLPDSLTFMMTERWLKLDSLQHSEHLRVKALSSSPLHVFSLTEDGWVRGGWVRDA